MIKREIPPEVINRAHKALDYELGDIFSTKSAWYEAYRCRLDYNHYAQYIFDNDEDYTYFMLRFA